MPADRVPYPCRVWTRAGLNCPPGFLALVEDEDDDDDDDDDTSLPWQAVGRRLRDRLSPDADRAMQMAELSLVFDEVRQVLDRRTVLQQAAWAQFDIPHVVPRLVRQTTGGRPWKEEVAIAAVIVLAGFAVYRGMTAGRMRLQTGSVVLGAAGIVAPFLAGMESEPRTLNMVPGFAYAQYQDRRRRRLEEEVTGYETGELIFEEPPGGGAPAGPIHYMWPGQRYGQWQVRTTTDRDMVKAIFQDRSDNNWLIQGTTEAEVIAWFEQVRNAGWEHWYRGLYRALEQEFGRDPLQEEPGIPGSEEESANAEPVDESTPAGNRW